jgi:hypothetical protein
MMRTFILLAVCSPALFFGHPTYGADDYRLEARNRVVSSDPPPTRNIPRAGDAAQDLSVAPTQTEPLILLLLGASLLVIATGVRVLQTRKSQMSNH